MDWDHSYALPRRLIDNVEDNFIPITVNEVEEVVNVFDDSDFVLVTEDQVEEVEEDLDDSDLDPDYIPITEHQVEEVEEVEEDLNDSNFNPDLTPITEYQDNQLIEVSRKKKKFSPADKKSVLEDKRELKNVNAKTKHPNRPLTCPVECKNKCRDNLSTDHQKLLWKTYWSLTTYVQRRQFLAKCITLTSVKRRTTVEGSVDNFKKSQSRIYKLPDSEKNEVQVCKTTLLNVLGYTNDSVLTELVKNMNSNFCMSSVTENRGQQNIKKCIAKDIVVDHIKLYKPSVSHYRRLNAPNIMYLPFGLTVKAMYDDFCLQHKNYCSQEFYRQIIKDLNISLRNPTIDKCEDCSTYLNIIENSTDENEIRVNNTLLENHKAKALAASSKYKEDSKLSIESTSIYSMDLQKVILIPNMPDTKSSFFTSRLVVFNETFAQLKPNALCHCVLWHEAIAGRKAENVTDSILALISNQRDVQDFIFWADNCTGQNKNWTLYTALVCNLNSTNSLFQNTKSVTMKYLTKGHTHMTADGVHGNIEKKFKQIRNIYDFEDLKNCISQSRQNLNILELKDFYEWQNKKRTTNVKTDTLYGFKMNSVVMAKFSRGSTCMEYWTDFNGEPKTLNFLQKKFLKDIKTYAPKKITQLRGINLNKKKGIVDKLVPVMPENRKHFWINLPVSDASEDLVDEMDLGNGFRTSDYE
ncbi:unnamed protein product [Aphis gossypii]|uniref:DUF7869 domain-containing protein n=1 Tax=Aphis gossypii TaxID=80765 RepID=A0A9P0INQ9_APHGO|nr:unnamed protein product [Aphis gossypii]